MKKQSNKHPAFRYVIILLLAAVIGVNFYTAIASNLAGNQVPMPFGVGASVVLSGSMEPTLSVGDLLLLQEQESYNVNDVVVYQSGGVAVVHRVVAIDGETVITRGDANNAADDPFPVSAIKGKVVTAIPLVGYVAWALKTPIGILVTIVAAILSMEISYRRDKEKKDEETEKLKAEIQKLKQEIENS